MVTGEGFPTGDALSRHPGLDKISFTGSVPTGQRYVTAWQVATASASVLYTWAINRVGLGIFVFCTFMYVHT